MTTILGVMFYHYLITFDVFTKKFHLQLFSTCSAAQIKL